MRNKHNLYSVLQHYVTKNNISATFAVERCGDNTVITQWKSSSPQPTDEQLSAIEQEAELKQNKYNYKALRKEAYPSAGDQLDMLWHTFKEYKALRGSCPACAVLDPLANVFEGWFNSIKAIKDRYPKP